MKIKIREMEKKLEGELKLATLLNDSLAEKNQKKRSSSFFELKTKIDKNSVPSINLTGILRKHEDKVVNYDKIVPQLEQSVKYLRSKVEAL